MEIGAPNDAFGYDDQTTSVSIDLLDQTISLSSNKQQQLLVNFSERDLREESSSDQSINDEDDDDEG